MKKLIIAGDIVIADSYDEDSKWNICLGQVGKVDVRDGMLGIYILDSKEPKVNPDGEYGLNWGDGIRWYGRNQLRIVEKK